MPDQLGAAAAEPRGSEAERRESVAGGQTLAQVPELPPPHSSGPHPLSSHSSSTPGRQPSPSHSGREGQVEKVMSKLVLVRHGQWACPWMRGQEPLLVGVRMGLISLLSCCMFVFDLDTHALQAEHSSWIFITAMIVACAAGDCLGQAMVKSFDRVLGTFIGGLLGTIMYFLTHCVSLFGSQWLERLFVTVGLSLVVGLGFYWMTDFSAKSHRVRTHQYAFLCGVITVGLVWLTFEQAKHSQYGLYWRAVNRLSAIIVGCIIGMLVLAVFHPGSAGSVIHNGLSTMSRSLAQMIQELCLARIERQPLASLTEAAKGGFKHDDSIRVKYRAVQEKVGGLRSLVPFIKWEPRCFYPATVRPLLSKSSSLYRLLIGRISRINATAMAMDVQLRTFDTLTGMDPAVSTAVRELTSNLGKLLDEAARRLDALAEGKDLEVGEGGSELEMRVRECMEELGRAAQCRRLQRTISRREGKLREYIRSFCSPVVEESYTARASSAFVFLLMQLSVQVVIYSGDIQKLVNGIHDGESDGSDEDRDEDESGHAEGLRNVVPEGDE